MRLVIFLLMQIPLLAIAFIAWLAQLTLQIVAAVGVLALAIIFAVRDSIKSKPTN